MGLQLIDETLRLYVGKVEELGRPHIFEIMKGDPDGMPDDICLLYDDQADQLILNADMENIGDYVTIIMLYMHQNRRQRQRGRKIIRQQEWDSDSPMEILDVLETAIMNREQLGRVLPDPGSVCDVAQETMIMIPESRYEKMVESYDLAMKQLRRCGIDRAAPQAGGC